MACCGAVQSDFNETYCPCFNCNSPEVHDAEELDATAELPPTSLV